MPHVAASGAADSLGGGWARRGSRHLAGRSFAHDVCELDDRMQLDPVVRLVAGVLEVKESDPLHCGGAVEHPILER